MRKAVAIVLALWISAQAPLLALTWEGDRLHVQKSEGCIYLVGAARPDTWISCAEGPVALRTGGDQNYIPQGRTVELRHPISGAVLVSVAVPPRYQLWFPLMANQNTPP